MIPKFRAWDKILKKMFYGKLEVFDDSIGFRFGHFEDDEPIFMQSTGLKDKNGKKIFEGDIVKFYRNLRHINGEVEIYKGHPIMRIYYSLEEYSKDLSYMSVELYDFMQVEVVGNIHQNIELLANKD